MKKILALFLVLVMMLSVALVACSDNTTTSGNNSDGVEDNDDDPGFVSKNPGKDTSDDTDDGDDTDDKSNQNNNDWNTVSYSVYAMCKINIRTEPASTASSKGQVEAKTALSAIAKSTDEDDCWYKINYDGGTYYVDADYVTTNLNEATFTDIAEADQFEVTVKAPTDNETQKNTVKLRELPTFDADYTYITVSNEDTAPKPMTVIGMNATKDWYIVKYDGKTYYLAVTSKTKPYLSGLPSEGGNDGPVGG